MFGRARQPMFLFAARTFRFSTGPMFNERLIGKIRDTSLILAGAALVEGRRKLQELLTVGFLHEGAMSAGAAKASRLEDHVAR